VKALRRLRREGKSIRAIAVELKLSTGTVQKLVKQQAA
jgi:DNA-binding NarL/FixJ family response regulator